MASKQRNAAEPAQATPSKSEGAAQLQSAITALTANPLRASSVVYIPFTVRKIWMRSLRGN